MTATKDESKAVAMLLGVCSFISYVVFHGLLGSYIFSVYSRFHDPSHTWGPDPQSDASLLAAAIVGTVIGAYAGSLSWLSHLPFKQGVGFARRWIVAIASPSLIGCGLLTMLKHPNDWTGLAIYLIPGAVFGLTSGLISEARRNPWGVLFRSVGGQQRKNTPFAIITGLGLRLGGLFGLLAFAFLLADFSGLSPSLTREDLLFNSFVLTYFGLTILIASVSPPRWIVLITGLVINVPTVFLAVNTWDVAKSWAVPIVYLLLWILFIASRPASVRRQKLEGGGRHRAELRGLKEGDRCELQ